MPTATARTCWIAGAVLGVLVWLLTAGSAGWFAGLFLALVAGFLLAQVLIWASVGGHPAMDGSDWQPSAAVPAETAPAAPPPAPAAPDDAALVDDVQAVAAPAAPADDGEADDLTKIKGVGPKLGELLHRHGVTRFAQIAAWDEAEIDRFAAIVGRMGSRIRGDDWVGQAKRLAADGGA